MRVLVIENYPKTTLGLVGDALAETDVECHIVRTHLGEALPATHNNYDALIMLGGAQDALDDKNHPYLPHEAEVARSFGEADKAVLGICLGAQILARAYGAKNILGNPIEFGWHPVRPTAAGRSDPVLSAIGDSAPIFHWHLDTFTLPPGAAHLATSAQTPMQAFRIGRASYGIQFHFEAGTELVNYWTTGFADEIADCAPDWPKRHRAEAAKHGAAADAAGLALARAWIGLMQEPSPSRKDPAKKGRKETVPEYSK
jgi:GMP synthase (glutamine-hydrolysing)